MIFEFENRNKENKNDIRKEEWDRQMDRPGSEGWKRTRQNRALL